jgi:hypothetical protein
LLIDTGVVPPEAVEDEDAAHAAATLPPVRRAIELGAATPEYRGMADHPYLESGDPLTIRLEFEVAVEIEDVSFGVTVMSDRGEVVFSEVRHAIYGGGVFSPGVGEIALVFDAIPLLDGRFTVNLDVRDAHGLVIDALEPACQFEVMYPGRAVGLVALNFKFDLTAPAGRNAHEPQ